MMNLIKRMRQWYAEHSIPMQFLGALVNFIGAMVWMPLLYIILYYIDEIMLGKTGHGIHWFCWVLFWVMGLLKCVTWFLYSAMDIDQDGVNG